MTFDKDYTGILVSSLCLLHCVAGLAIVTLGLTSIGLSFLFDEKIHLFLAFPIILLALWSIPDGYGIHQNPFPLIKAIVGIILLVMGLLIHHLEVILTFLASSLMIIAHLYNKILLKNT